MLFSGSRPAMRAAALDERAQHLLLALRRVNRGAFRLLHDADLVHEIGPLVQEPHELLHRAHRSFCESQEATRE